MDHRPFRQKQTLESFIVFFLVLFLCDFSVSGDRKVSVIWTLTVKREREREMEIELEPRVKPLSYKVKGMSRESLSQKASHVLDTDLRSHWSTGTNTKEWILLELDVSFSVFFFLLPFFICFVTCTISQRLFMIQVNCMLLSYALKSELDLCMVPGCTE